MGGSGIKEINGPVSNFKKSLEILLRTMRNFLVDGLNSRMVL